MLLQFESQNCTSPENLAAKNEYKRDEADIDAIVKGAEEFSQRVGVLDRQVEEIKWRNWPDPSPQALSELSDLESQKEAIVFNVTTKMKGLLRSSSAEKLSRRVNEHVKPKMKLLASPKSSEDEMQRFSLQPVYNKQPLSN